MKVTQVELSPTCHLTKFIYGECVSADISLDYIEHSSDHYHSDDETSIDIDKEKAVEIVEFLNEAFLLNLVTQK